MSISQSPYHTALTALMVYDALRDPDNPAVCKALQVEREERGNAQALDAVYTLAERFEDGLGLLTEYEVASLLDDLAWDFDAVPYLCTTFLCTSPRPEWRPEPAAVAQALRGLIAVNSNANPWSG
jgi:hypothetical protein